MPRPAPAMVEDADDNDNVIEGSYKYAKSNVTSIPPSPTKQEMNTGRKKSSRRAGSVSPAYTPNDSDSTPQASSLSKRELKDRERRKSISQKGKPHLVTESPKRPSARSSRTAPVIGPTSGQLAQSDEAAYYGVTHQTIPASTRPRANTARPQSYYGSSPRPPLSNSAYYGIHGGPPGPPPGIPTSFPPPPWMGPAPLASSAMAAPPPIDYFSRGQADLSARFSRPSSAMGFRSGSYGREYDDFDGRHEQALMRRPSQTKRAAKEQEDRNLMPPPPTRPVTTQPPRVPFRPPPTSSKRVGFEDNDLVDCDADLYHPMGRRAARELAASRSKRHSLSRELDIGNLSLEPSSKSKRASSYNLEDKMKSAAQYQDDVTGAQLANLTAENLRHVKTGSSRSTRSSASRDESSFRQSATTRTTRSGSGDEEITIKVPSGAVVEVGNAKINCVRGGEINIGRAGGGSDRGTSYGDDYRSRADRSERPSIRTRASSQSAYARAIPYPSYGLPPYHSGVYPPPYPAYPGTYDSDEF